MLAISENTKTTYQTLLWCPIGVLLALGRCVQIAYKRTWCRREWVTGRSDVAIFHQIDSGLVPRELLRAAKYDPIFGGTACAVKLGTGRFKFL